MKSSKKRRRKALFIIMIVCVLIGAIFFGVRRNVKPVIYTYCDALITALGESAINAAAAEVVSQYEYSDFIDLERDKEGKIVFLGTNAATVNAFARTLALRSETALNSIGKQRIYVPIGAFSGSALMSNSGPEVAVDITFFSSVRCDFITTFEHVGINQTRHCIYAKTRVLFNTVLPIAEHEIELTNDLLVAENVIVGEIPNVFVSGTDSVDYLDLIP